MWSIIHVYIKDTEVKKGLGDEIHGPWKVHT